MESRLRGILESSQKIAFLAGSGISIAAPTRFPSGFQFTQQLLETIAPNEACLRRLLDLSTSIPDDNDPGRAFIRFENLLHQVATLYDLDLDLLDYFADSAPNHNHYFLAKALSAGHPVLTTNFDLEVEHACEDMATNYSRIATDEEFQRLSHHLESNAAGLREHSPGGVGLLIKLHGSLDCKDSLCATLTQIGKLGYRWQRAPHRSVLLNHVFSNYPVVVVGYSGLDDFDVNPVLEQLNRPQPIVWIQHVADQEPKIVKLSSVSVAPPLLGRLSKTSFRDCAIHLVQGDTFKFLTMLASVLGLSDAVRQSVNPNRRAVAKGDLRDYLNSWAAEQRLNDKGRQSVLCASLFASVDLHEIAKEIITDDFVEMMPIDRGHRENLLGSEAFRQSDWRSASAHFKRGWAIFSSLRDDLNRSVMLNNLGNVALKQGRVGEARQFYEASLDTKLHCDPPRGIFAPLAGLAEVARQEGDPDAIRYFLSLAVSASKQEGNLEAEARLSMALATDLGQQVERDVGIELNDWRGLLTHLSKGLLLGWSYHLEAEEHSNKAARRRNAQIDEAQADIPESARQQVFILPRANQRVHREFKRAIAALKQARERYLQGGNLNGVHDVSARLANAYYGIQDWEGYQSATDDRFRFALMLRDPALVVKALQDLNSAAVSFVFPEGFEADDAIPLPRSEETTSMEPLQESKAVAFLINCLSIVEQFLDEIGARNAWNGQLAEVYYRLALETFTTNLTRAINWANSAIAIYEELGPREMEAHAKARMGRIQGESKHYQSALAMYEEALGIFESIGSPVASEIRKAIQMTTLLMRVADHSS